MIESHLSSVRFLNYDTRKILTVPGHSPFSIFLASALLSLPATKLSIWFHRPTAEFSCLAIRRCRASLLLFELRDNETQYRTSIAAHGVKDCDTQWQIAKIV